MTLQFYYLGINEDDAKLSANLKWPKFFRFRRRNFREKISYSHRQHVRDSHPVRLGIRICHASNSIGKRETILFWRMKCNTFDIKQGQNTWKKWNNLVKKTSVLELILPQKKSYICGCRSCIVYICFTCWRFGSFMKLIHPYQDIWQIEWSSENITKMWGNFWLARKPTGI